MTVPAAENPDTEIPVVVVVDDDPMVVETLAGNLAHADLKPIPLVSGQAALDFFATGQPFDALILDWQMPNIDGPTVLEKARAMGITVPAIFLTGLSQSMYEERGLALGAVDFVDKTKSFAIILQRLRLALAGAKGGAGGEAGGMVKSVTRHGHLELQSDSARALWQGATVPLTLSEFRVVQLLAAKGGGDVTYRAIYDVVRGEGFQAGAGEDGYRANVRALIKRVRQKFRDLDPGFEALENYPGFGYRWRADI